MLFYYSEIIDHFTAHFPGTLEQYKLTKKQDRYAIKPRTDKPLTRNKRCPTVIEIYEGSWMERIVLIAVRANTDDILRSLTVTFKGIRKKNKQTIGINIITLYDVELQSHCSLNTLHLTRVEQSASKSQIVPLATLPTFTTCTIRSSSHYIFVVANSASNHNCKLLLRGPTYFLLTVNYRPILIFNLHPP